MLAALAGLALAVCAAAPTAASAVPQHPTAASQTATGSVTGTVTNTSGMPVVGATVTVTNYYSIPEASATTAADGTYTIAGLQHGSSRVEFTASGYVTQWWNNQPDNAHSNTINVPAGGTATANATLGISGISGTVTDASGPVANAAVGVFTVNSSNQPGTEVGHTTTAADGTYNVPSLAAGNYFVLFDSPAGSTDAGQWYNNSPSAAGATQVTVTVTGGPIANAELAPGPRASISGTVTDRSGNPIAGATVKAVAADGTTTVSTAMTAADDTYTINNLDVGIDTVWFVPPTGSSYFGNVWNNAIGKVVPLTVDQGSTFTGINSKLSQSGSLTGTVTGASGPLAGATLTVTNYYGIPEGTATTAADGTYTVTGLAPGSSRVEFTAAGYTTQWWNNQPDIAHSNTINVPNNGTTTANATLVLSGGLVTDADGPVAGTTVTLFTVNSSNQPETVFRQATTGADGRYDISGISGTYFVLFSPPAGSSDVGQWYNNSPTAAGATQFTVPATNDVTASAQLSPGPRGSISGTVTDRSGNPITGATVNAVAADGTTTVGTATTAADGTYTINNLDVGIDTVQFLPPAGSNYRASNWNAALTVDQGSTFTGINASLAQNGSVSGTVTDTSGAPVSGATVTVTNYYGFTETTATTAADGTYTVTGLAPGSSRVHFTASLFNGLQTADQWWNNQPDFAHSNTINVPNGGTISGINAALTFTGLCIPFC